MDRFFTNMHTPINFAEEVGEGNDLSQLNIMGVFAIIVGLFICSLVVITQPIDPTASRLGILFVGGFVTLIGLLFVTVARRSRNG